MIISLKHRFIFIKGIKVAGTSVESYLSQVLEDDAIVAPLPDGHFPDHKGRNYLSASGELLFRDHTPATEIRSIIGPWLYNRLYKFGIIRNPFDKLFSLYAMRKFADPEYTLERTMAEIDSEKGRLCDGEALIVHRVILYENLDAELKEIFNRLNIPFHGKLENKERSESRSALKDESINLSVEDINEMTRKFSFELNLYRQFGRPIAMPLAGEHKIGANEHFYSKI